MPEPLIIKVRPYLSGWRVDAGEDVQPYYETREKAISYARERMKSGGARLIQVFDAGGMLIETIEK